MIISSVDGIKKTIPELIKGSSSTFQMYTLSSHQTLVLGKSEFCKSYLFYGNIILFYGYCGQEPNNMNEIMSYIIKQGTRYCAETNEE